MLLSQDLNYFVLKFKLRLNVFLNMGNWTLEWFVVVVVFVSVENLPVLI